MLPRLLAILALLLSFAHLEADDATVIFPSQRQGAAKRLEEVRRLVSAKDWDGVFTQIDAILEEGSDDLVPVSPSQSVQAR